VAVGRRYVYAIVEPPLPGNGMNAIAVITGDPGATDHAIVDPAAPRHSLPCADLHQGVGGLFQDLFLQYRQGMLITVEQSDMVKNLFFPFNPGAENLLLVGI